MIIAVKYNFTSWLWARARAKWREVCESGTSGIGPSHTFGLGDPGSVSGGGKSQSGRENNSGGEKSNSSSRSWLFLARSFDLINCTCVASASPKTRVRIKTRTRNKPWLGVTTRTIIAGKKNHSDPKSYYYFLVFKYCFTEAKKLVRKLCKYMI